LLLTTVSPASASGAAGVDSATTAPAKVWRLPPRFPTESSPVPRPPSSSSWKAVKSSLPPHHRLPTEPPSEKRTNLL
ncbi:hypothetical protein CFC21_084446, partial [Triticum aestivum]